MKSPNMSEDSASRGASLIEMTIVIALSLIVAGIVYAFIPAADMNRRVREEARLVTMLLEKTRSGALVDTGGEFHGFVVEPDSYVIWKGDRYDPGSSRNLEYPRDPRVAVDAELIVFSGRSARIMSTTHVRIGFGDIETIITINHEGAILL